MMLWAGCVSSTFRTDANLSVELRGAQGNGMAFTFQRQGRQPCLPHLLEDIPPEMKLPGL